MNLPTTQLIVFRLAPGTSLEGGMLGALERVEANTSLRIVDVLFARRTAEAGDLEVVTGDNSSGALAAAAIEFRLDETARREGSARALEAHPELGQLADALEPGAAVAAVLVEHRWLAGFAEEVARTGGEAARSEFTDATAVRELLPQLVDSVKSR